MQTKRISLKEFCGDRYEDIKSALKSVGGTISKLEDNGKVVYEKGAFKPSNKYDIKHRLSKR